MIYLIYNAAVFFTYLADKFFAVRHKRRIPETVLLSLMLLGGWPGAALAMSVSHHKISKPLFTRLLLVAAVLSTVFLYMAPPELVYRIFDLKRG